MDLTTCWWAARRLDRYLDADPAAVLSDSDVRRLERHASTCRRCAADLAERREVREKLRRHRDRSAPDVSALRRLDALADHLRTRGKPA